MEERSYSYLATGHARTANARTRIRNGWTEIARVLNSEGNGCLKDWKQWAKYWKDKKAAVKRKANAAEAARQRTGGGVDEERVELSELEQRIVAIAGGVSFATGDRHLCINTFPEQEIEAPLPAESETNSGQSESILMQLQNNPGPSTGYPNMMVPETDPINTATAGEGLVHNYLGSPPVAPQVATPAPGDDSVVVHVLQEDETMSLSEGILIETNQMPCPTASTTSGDGGVRRRILVATPSRRGRCPQTQRRSEGSPRRQRDLTPRVAGAREVSAAARRRLLRRSPPSQRRSEMANLTERFIAIEERRVDAESAIIQSQLAFARAQEMYAQGHLKIAEAIAKLTDKIL